MIEYQVREVTRFIITRYETDESGIGSISTIGPLENNQMANEVASALSYREPGSTCRLLDTPTPTPFG